MTELLELQIQIVKSYKTKELHQKRNKKNLKNNCFKKFLSVEPLENHI